MIATPVINKAVKKYIDTGNNTLSYMASHPEASKECARKNANQFMANCGVKEKALILLEKNDRLKLSSLISSFTDDLDSTKPVYFKGQRIASDPDNSTRLETKKFILEKLYSLGKNDISIDNRQVNIGVNGQDVGKLDSIIDKLNSLGDQYRVDKGKLDTAREL